VRLVRHGRHARHRRPLSAGARAWLTAFASTASVLLAATLTLAMTAGAESVGSAAAPAATPTSSTVPAADPPCPLSGLRPPGGKVPQHPALAVKVDNYPEARPQSGLDKADVVFEEPVEGGITRLVAVFQCQSASLVGPIRSAREVDSQILDELSRPVFVHVGGITPVLSIIADADDFDENVSANGSTVQNPSGRYPPYDTYISTAAGWGLQPTDATPPAPIFTYSPTAPAGSPVTSLHIPYSQTNDVTWTWSSDSGSWLLAYSGEPATVANGGQIAVPNIVVQTVHVSYGPWAENESGALEVESQLTGSGPLAVFRNGVEVKGTWQRSSMGSPTRLVASDGSVIALEPGETWIEIVPSAIPVTTTGPSSVAGSNASGPGSSGPLSP